MKSHSFQSAAGHKKWYAQQVSQKQRRIAQRQQAAAAVAHDENEEDDRVLDVLPLAVGFQQRTDQQHRRAGGADETRQNGARGEKCTVGQGMGGQVALDANAAADGVQAEQENDERDVLGLAAIAVGSKHSAGLADVNSTPT